MDARMQGVLERIVAEYGREVARDARRCEALLKDFCRGEHRLEVNLLVTTVKEGVAADLLAAHGLPPTALIGRAARRLEGTQGLAPDRARWAVVTWAVALGAAALGESRPVQRKPGAAVPGRAGWVLVRPLGVGGFGEVWLARNPGPPTLEAAVKFCHPEHATHLRLETGLIERVRSVGPHRNVVELRDVHLGDVPWLMYEFVVGGDLAVQLPKWAKLDPPERLRQAVVAFKQVVSGVAHFHRQSLPVVHGDLKPGNILVDRIGRRLVVTDFGICAALAGAGPGPTAGTTTRLGAFRDSPRAAHTALYASPQQQAGAPPERRDDVYALGVIAYQLLTDRLDQGPGTDFSHDLSELGLAPRWAALIGDCTALKPDRRPADAVELLSRLTDLGTEPNRPAGARPSVSEREAETPPFPATPSAEPTARARGTTRQYEPGLEPPLAPAPRRDPSRQGQSPPANDLDFVKSLLTNGLPTAGPVWEYAQRQLDTLFGAKRRAEAESNASEARTRLGACQQHYQAHGRRLRDLAGDGLEYIEAALEVEPQRSEYWYLKGMLLSCGIGEHREALVCLKRAGHLEPDSVLVRLAIRDVRRQRAREGE